MASTFHGIETARRSLMTQRTALETTGHNIANANTEGYTRQRVNMQASIPMEAYGVMRSLTPGQLGTGVEFDSITRIRSGYLDNQFRNENGALGSWSIQSEVLSKIEGIVNEPSDTGLRKVMDNFWKSWSDLSKDTESMTARQVVKQNALALTDAFNQTAKQLGDLRQDLTTNIAVKGKEMQSYMSSIADLNRSISRIESLGDNANDLRDQRDLLTDKLSKIVGITVTEEQGTGYYNISIRNAAGQAGQALVTGVEATNLQAEAPAAEGSPLETILAAAGSGEVQGMFLARDSYVKDYQGQLNQIVDTMANGTTSVTIPAGSALPKGVTLLSDITLKGGAALPAGQAFPEGGVVDKDTVITVAGMNGLHQLGFSTDGTSTPGAAFFTIGDPANAAATFSVNPLIADNASKIASSIRVDASGSAVKGNNGLALLIANLKDNKFTPVEGGTGATIGDKYGAMIGQLGIQAQEAARKTTNAESLATQVDTNRQSVSGVSQDEEMTNLVKFQQAYNASARFMTTYDEMLDKLINSTGTVGR